MADTHYERQTNRDTKRTWGILASLLALALLGWGLYEAMDNDDGATGAEVDDTDVIDTTTDGEVSNTNNADVNDTSDMDAADTGSSAGGLGY